MPRHPPNALTTLNRSHCQCSSLVGFGIPILFACAQRGSKSGHTASSNNLVTFYNQIIQMPSTCSIRLLYWNYAEQFTCNLIFKTSFSRLNPGPRGQATVIRSPIRRCNKASNNRRSRATSFLPTSSPSFVSSRLGHPRRHWNWARTLGRTQHLEASRSIFSSRYMQNRHQA